MNYKTTTTIMGALLLSTSFAVAETFTILLIGPSFQPDSVVVSPGDTIRWVNATGGVRTVTSGNPCVADGLFDGELPDYDTSFSWEVPLDASDGDIPFFCEDSCKIGMVGTITVFNDTVVRNVPADYPTIASAIAAAQSGDHIAIAAGTYYEHSLEIGEGDQVEDYDLLIIGEIGADGMPAVTIDAQQQGRVFTVDGRHDSEIRLMNLVITGGGNVDKGGGILCGFGLKLVNCTIAGNTATQEGGGLWNSGLEDDLWGTLDCIDCRFMDNSAPKGGGLWIFYSFSDFFDCIISGNSANEGGGMYQPYYQGADLTDSVVCGNISTDNNQIVGTWNNLGGNCMSPFCSDDDGDGVPDSCMTDEDGILHVPGDYPTIADAIDAANVDDIIYIAAGTYYEANLTLGAADITLRGEANADGTPAVTIDAQQQGRVFEMVGGGPPPGIAGLVIFDTLIITGGAVNGNGGGVSITNCSPTFLNCTITQNSCTGNGGGVFVYHQGEGAPWTGASPLLIGCTIIGNEAQDGGGMFSSSNGYGAGAQPSLDGCIVTENTASNGIGGIRHATSPGQTTVINSIICGNVPSQIAGSVVLDANSCAALTCVDDDGDGLPDSCQGDEDGILHVPDEYATILIALQNASDGNTIAIAAGTYLLEGNGLEIAVGMSLSIIGDTHTDGTPAVILDGQLSGVYGIIVSNPTGQTVIENIHIVGCQDPLRVVNSSVLVTNCIIENGSGNYGGVVLTSCVATLNACSVIGNSGTFGGGISVIDGNGPSSEVSLIDCVIEDNYGAYPGYAVGGITLYHGHTTITNCTVKNNIGGGIGGVGILADATATIAGTTVCGNVGYKGNTTQLSGDYTDGGGNTIAEECPADCVEDINGDGTVSVSDLLMLIGAWGPCDGCVEDIDDSGEVNVSDLLTVIASWGDCE